MNSEEFELAIAKLLEETNIPEISKRNRAWRRKNHIKKVDRLLRRVQGNYQSYWSGRYIGGDDWWNIPDGRNGEPDEFKHVPTAHKRKLYITYRKTSHLRQWCRQMTSRRVRRSKDVPDGCLYKKYFDLPWTIC